MKKKIRLTIDLSLREDAMQQHHLTPEDVLEGIRVTEEEACDGVAVTTCLPGCDCSCDFFLSGATLVSADLMDSDASDPTQFLALACYERELSLLGICNSREEARALIRKDITSCLGYTEEELALPENHDTGNPDFCYAGDYAWGEKYGNNYDWAVIACDDASEDGDLE